METRKFLSTDEKFRKTILDLVGVAYSTDEQEEMDYFGGLAADLLQVGEIEIELDTMGRYLCEHYEYYLQ